VKNFGYLKAAPAGLFLFERVIADDTQQVFTAE